MEIAREKYLDKLEARLGNGQIKVVTGLRRSGKSYLLFDMFRRRLLSNGLSDRQIIQVALDEEANEGLRDPHALAAHIDQEIALAGGRCVVMIDEVQLAIAREEMRDPNGMVRLYGVLNGLLRRDGVDVSVTGSNSKMLSKDVMTEYRGRGDAVQVSPLTFAEFHAYQGGHPIDDYVQYALWGGMPAVVTRPEDQRYSYLEALFSEVFFRDVIERYEIERPELLGQLTDDLCSSIGSLTNATRIANTIRSVQRVPVSQETVATYLVYLTDSSLFRNAKRYDVKGKRYFEYPSKYYCADVGLRNVRLGLRQQEETHIMENVLYNELVCRGYAVDVGVVELVDRDESGQRHQRTCEIDFVANKGGRRVYVQSALSMGDANKAAQELRPLLKVDDNFTKMVVSKTSAAPWTDERGILHVGLYDFLLDEGLLREWDAVPPRQPADRILRSASCTQHPAPSTLHPSCGTPCPCNSALRWTSSCQSLRMRDRSVCHTRTGSQEFANSELANSQKRATWEFVNSN